MRQIYLYYFFQLVLIFEKATSKIIQALVPAAPVLHNSSANNASVLATVLSISVLSAPVLHSSSATNASVLFIVEAIYGVLSGSRICRNLRVFGAKFLWQYMCLCYLNHFLQLCALYYACNQMLAKLLTTQKIITFVKFKVIFLQI